MPKAEVIFFTMEDIRIYSVDSKLIYIAPITDSAERSAQVRGNNQIKLSWYAVKCDILPALSYLDYNNERFYLKSSYRPQKEARDLFKYDVAFCKIEGVIINSIFFRNVDVDGVVWQEPEFSLNANKLTITQLIVESINMLPNIQKLGLTFQTPFKDGDAVYHDYLNTKLKAFSFSGNKYSEVLSQVADEFETEFWFEDTNDSNVKILHFDMCLNNNDEYEMSDDYSEDGLVSGGLSSVEINHSNELPEKIYVYGSERNITKKTVEKQVAGGVMNVSYAKKLRLNSKVLPYQDKTEAGVAITVNTRDSSISIDNVSNGFQEVYINNEIYPKMDMFVSNVRSAKGANDMPIFYIQSSSLTTDYMDSKIAESYPESINPSRQGLLIDGMTLMVTFTSGLLNGMEFECSWNPKNAEIGLVPIEDEDQQLPYGNYCPRVGDRFVLWNLAMPQSRIEIAQDELLQDAKNHIDKIIESVNGCKCKTDDVFYSQYGLSFPISLGQRIKITSEVFANSIYQEAFLRSRVISYSYKLTKPHDISFELSEARRQGIIDTLTNQLTEMQIQAKQTEQLSRSISRRQNHDVAELKDMIDSIQTQMLVVGLEHDNFTMNAGLIYDNDKKILTIEQGDLIHNDYVEYGDNGSWKVYKTEINLNDDFYNSDTPYYLYAICPKEHSAVQEVVLSSDIIEDNDNNLAFLIGILSSEFDGSRVFNRTSGLTTITGGTITTEQIQDYNRQLIIDFSSNPPRIIARNSAEICGNIKFLSKDGAYKSLMPTLEERMLLGGFNILNNSGEYTEGSSFVLTNPNSNAEKYEETNMYALLEKGKEYVLSLMSNKPLATNYTNGIEIYLLKDKKYTEYIGIPLDGKGLVKSISSEQINGNYKTICVFNVNNSGEYYIRLDCNQRNTTASFWNLQIEEGNFATTWKRPIDYISQALQGSTEIEGGLVLTNILEVKNIINNVTGGISGLKDDDDNIFLWAGGSAQDAKDMKLPFVINHDGTGKIGNLFINKNSVSVMLKDYLGNHKGWLHIQESGFKMVDENGNNNVYFTVEDSNDFAKIGSEIQSVTSSRDKRSKTYYTDYSPTSTNIISEDAINLYLIGTDSKYTNFKVKIKSLKLIMQHRSSDDSSWKQGHLALSDSFTLIIGTESGARQSVTWDDFGSIKYDGSAFYYNLSEEKELEFNNIYTKPDKVQIKGFDVYAKTTGETDQVMVNFYVSIDITFEVNKHITIIAKNGIAHMHDNQRYMAYYHDSNGSTHFKVNADEVEIKQKDSIVVTGI